MSDASELRAHLRAPFSDAQVEEIWRGVQARRARSARPAWLALCLPALAAAVLGVALRRERAPSVVDGGVGPLRLVDGSGVTAARLRNDALAPATVRLSDRSTLTLHPHTTLLPTHNDGRAMELQLRQGAADFAVTPGGPRRWRIDCGVATITVVGTAFTLDRRESSLRVAVSHGTVWVDGAWVPGGHRVLTAGQSLAVSRPAPRAPQVVVAASSPPPSRPAPRAVVAAAPPWRAQAQRGDARGAWESLGDHGLRARSPRPLRPRCCWSSPTSRAAPATTTSPRRCWSASCASTPSTPRRRWRRSPSGATSSPCAPAPRRRRRGSSGPSPCARRGASKRTCARASPRPTSPRGSQGRVRRRARIPRDLPAGPARVAAGPGV